MVTVLLVEDFDDTRFMLSTLLKIRGCEVIEAVNGYEAVEIAQSRELDLVLMDINMPEMDGYTAAKLIRSHPGSCHLPIVAITALCTAERRLEALAAGCADCLPKPVGFDCIDHALSFAQAEIARKRAA